MMISALHARGAGIVLGCVLVFSSTDLFAQGGLTFDVVVENVRRNEQLYENVEVVHRQSYRIFGEKWMPFECLECQDRGRTVLQQGMIRVEHTRKQTESADKVVTITSLQGYDGEKTRMFEQEAVGNVHFGRVEDWRVFWPTQCGLGGPSISVGSRSTYRATRTRKTQ